MSKAIIHKLLSHGADEGASSLVVNHAAGALVFNYKFPDGHEQNFSLPAGHGDKLLKSLKQILKLSDSEIGAKDKFKLKEKNFELDFKLNIISKKEGEKIIIRIIKNDYKSRRLRQLGYSQDNLKLVQSLTKAKSGLIIISSPESQGKSSTLEALIKEMNTESINAYCFDKNPKRLLENINYLAPSEGNWEKVLKHDSDLIVIDDISNDKELVNAIKAANTGRLVIVSLNADSSLEIILRILKLELALNLKINSLRAIINQRLNVLNRNKKIKNNSRQKITRKEIAVSEILVLNTEIKEYLLDYGQDYKKEIFWKDFNKLIVKNGFKSLKSDLVSKINSGIVKK